MGSLKLFNNDGIVNRNFAPCRRRELLIMAIAKLIDGCLNARTGYRDNKYDNTRIAS